MGFEYNKKHDKIEFDAPEVSKVKKWEGDTDGNVYKDINRIQEIKNVDEIKDTGLNKPIKASIEFNERLFSDNYNKMKKMLHEKHNANAKMFVQKHELKGNTLILYF